MSKAQSDSEAVAGACKYLLLMLLQRLEHVQEGLIEDLMEDAAADRAAIEEAGPLSASVKKIFDQVESILKQADEG